MEEGTLGGSGAPPRGWPCADSTNVISAVPKWTIWVCTALAVGRVRVGTQDTQQRMIFSKDHWPQQGSLLSWRPRALLALTEGGQMGSR